VADFAAARLDPLPFFVHIPKTAGASLRHVLEASEGAHRIQRIGNVFKGGGGVKRALAERLPDDLKEIDLGGIRIVRGHVPLGVRAFLGDERELIVFTVLREPVERTISHFVQILESANGLPEDDASIESVAAAGQLVDNLQTRMLCDDPQPFGEMTDEMLEQAKRNIREPWFTLGLAERFDETLVLLRRRLGLRAILQAPEGRVSDSRPRDDAVPAMWRSAAERLNRYDIELYREAADLFDSTPELGELDFQVEVAALQAARSEGDLDLDVPAPRAYGGGGDEWRMQLAASASLLRHEQERATIQAKSLRLAQRGRERLECLAAEVEAISKVVSVG
jgi:hypothetical protein